MSVRACEVYRLAFDTGSDGGNEIIRDPCGVASGRGQLRGVASHLTAPELPMTAAPLFARLAALAVFAALTVPTPARAQPADAPNHTRTENVVYGERDGNALVLDVLTPKKPNGAGVIIFISAEYRSGRTLLKWFQATLTPFVDRGFVVFAVMHGSQPKYTVPEIVADAHRAVRFVKHNAKKYGVDPDKIGATGGSAGGHLALMTGCAGKPGNPKAEDAVERPSSKVAAVACLFPPSDFPALEKILSKDVAPAFDFREYDATTCKYERVSPERRREIARELSPLTHASKDTVPTFIIHGDADKVVPIEQSKALIAKLNECGATCKLKVAPEMPHAGVWLFKELPFLADWFETHLLGKK